MSVNEFDQLVLNSPLELAAFRPESPHAAVLSIFLPNPKAGKRNSMLRGLGSKPVWLHTPLGKAAVEAKQTYIHSSVCPWRSVVTPGWDSQTSTEDLAQGVGMAVTMGSWATCFLFLGLSFPVCKMR